MAIARFLYTLTMYLLTPVILYRLAMRGLRYREYFARWHERFGFFAAPGIERLDLGARGLGRRGQRGAAADRGADAALRRHAASSSPRSRPTGSARVRQLFGDRVFHVYLPYDLPASVKRFLDRVRPRIAVVMETEIWPNLFRDCRERRIPVVVANARLSETLAARLRPGAAAGARGDPQRRARGGAIAAGRASASCAWAPTRRA